MEIAKIKIGDRLRWDRIVSNWGHRDMHYVTVRKIGKRRVTVETDGGHKASVQPHNLFRATPDAGREADEPPGNWEDQDYADAAQRGRT